MRLFAALRPPAYARDDLSEHLSGLNVARAGLVPADNWHVTVAFIGPVKADAFDKVAGAVAETAGQVSAQLTLQLAGAGRFYAGDRNIVYTGLDGDTAALTQLARDLGTRLGKVGFACKERVYVPHLTVAYVHGRLPEAKLVSDVAALETYRGPRWVATELVLYRSHPSSAVRYEQLRRYLLP